MFDDQLSSAPIELFYSYSHKDERLRAKLEDHLSMLRLRGIMTGWHDRRIIPGTDWQKEIDERINSARLILLLISSDFIASEYATGVEAKRALERHDAGEARVIPVILRPVNLSGAPFSRLTALPTDGRPITTWANRERAFENVSKGIEAVIEGLRHHDVAFSTLVRPLLYGDVVKLRHKATGKRLHSHETTYVHEGGSGQQQVTAYGGADENDYWLVRGPHSEPLDYKQGEIVRRGDVIRLEHVRTTRNLHSHKIPGPVTRDQHEVSCFGNWGGGNALDDWRVEIEEDGDIWYWHSAVKLVHEATGWVLHSHDKPFWDDHQEVTCFEGRDDNDWWELSH